MIQADIALDPHAGVSPRAPGCEENNCGSPFCGCAHQPQYARTHGGPASGAGEAIAPGLVPKQGSTSKIAQTPDFAMPPILALDLGTKCGYALRQRGGRIIHGTQIFTPRASWSPGQKWQRYRAWLSMLVVENNVTSVAYEDVKRHIGTQAAHAFGGYLAMLEMVADQHRLSLQPVGVGTIKKSWTGKGNADKVGMVAEARRRGFRPETDNDADALAILHWAMAQERA